MEKIIEFNSIKEFSMNSEVNNDKIETLFLHHDKSRNKYITTIKYGKKTG